MIVVVKGGSTPAQVEEISDRLVEFGYQVNPIFGVEKTVIGAVGGSEHMKVDIVDQLKAYDYVEDVIVITKPYKFVAKETNRGEKSTVDLGDGVSVAAPAVPVLVEDVERRCVEREVVDERRQTDRLVEVDVVVGTDLLVVQLPEGHELFVATDRRIRREEEVLGPAAVLARSGGDHDLDELEAHQLGVEVIRGSRIAGGKGNVMERHC